MIVALVESGYYYPYKETLVSANKQILSSNFCRQNCFKKYCYRGRLQNEHAKARRGVGLRYLLTTTQSLARLTNIYCIQHPRLSLTGYPRMTQWTKMLPSNIVPCSFLPPIDLPSPPLLFRASFASCYGTLRFDYCSSVAPLTIG